jgi:hypothetical protein
MMLIQQPGGVYLIDRKFDFFFVHGYDSLLSLFATKGITLFDGEMVRHITTEKPYYLIFDLIVLDGVPCANKILEDRLKLIGNAVVQYRNARNEIPNPPFPLIGKVFRPRNEISSLMKNIVEKDGERYYADVDASKRYHKTDGLIFTPNERYNPKAVPNLFKWKYMDTVSIDLKINYKNNRTTIYFTCVGNEGNEIEYPLSVKPEDFERLRRDMSRQRDPNSIIVEFAYDFWRGMWSYKCIRADKNRPNHIKVVFDTLEIISENISIEEILYRIPLTPEQDHWPKRYKQVLQEILSDSKPRKPSHQLPPPPRLMQDGGQAKHHQQHYQHKPHEDKGAPHTANK